MANTLESEKEIKRKEYNIIRYSNSSSIHEGIKSNVNISFEILSRKYHIDNKFIGIYWPLKGEIDIRFLRNSNHEKFALPSSSKINGLNYHFWSNKKLEPDENNIPSPLNEKALKPIDISMLLVPAIAIDQEGYRLGYGGGYFDRLRKKNMWISIPSFVIISQNCISKKPLPRNNWDLPFNGWISENGLHQI